MNKQERLSKIESYGQAYQRLVAGLKGFPREMWQFRSAPDLWTVHEILVHIADSEANSYVRCRRFIAEPGEGVMAYDEMGWARRLDYHARDPQEALELFRWLRQISYHLISTLPEKVWSNTVYHPESGVMTLEDWLDVYERHIPDHLAQMQEVYEEWLKKQED
jgi:hypothetical protein